MDYAIIETGGKQYKVTAGQEILVDKIDSADGSKFVTTKILLVRTNGSILIGQPYITNRQVIGKVIGPVLGDKIRVSKFKAKVRYRKNIGFRASLTKILIEKIQLDSIKPRVKNQIKKDPKALTRVKK